MKKGPPVSYTHLWSASGSPRCRRGFLSPLPGVGTAGVPALEKTGLALVSRWRRNQATHRVPPSEMVLLSEHVNTKRDGGIPVSYTHLDVYKRQVYAVQPLRGGLPACSYPAGAADRGGESERSRFV